MAEDSDSDSDVAFATMDFAGVNFDEDQDDTTQDEEISESDKAALSLEKSVLIHGECVPDDDERNDDENRDIVRIRNLCKLVSSGRYADALKSQEAKEFFDIVDTKSCDTVASCLRERILTYCNSIAACIEVELLGVAALNMFLQLNYTGPSLDWGMTPAEIKEDPIKGINPHICFHRHLDASSKTGEHDQAALQEEKKESLTGSKRNTKYHNAVLSELTVDGEWPCQVCQGPYFLLVARSILLTLADPNRPDWSHSTGTQSTESHKDTFIPTEFSELSGKLGAIQLWSARAAVAHERLLQSRGPSATLWNEVEAMFQVCLALFCDSVDPVAHDLTEHYEERSLAACVMLEWGLAQHHFNREGKGKSCFLKAMELSGLEVEVTGAEGKRTKFQQQATAQMLVRASSAAPALKHNSKIGYKSKSQGGEGVVQSRKGHIISQMIEHDEEEILLEKIEFEDEEHNKVGKLTVLDQSIILALCLDVKNNNPKDGLTGEQMGAYLARVLHHHDDWMVYSTALLERAWLESERSHGRERAILQIQALTDQHTNRLTVTQSTFQSVEDSAPPHERLKNLHTIVYPPRWSMFRDLAERYAKMGVVTSAAEIFEELELWGEVVECYRHAGKENKAEKIVRERLEQSETPRMWAALGDLTNDPAHYEKALEVSNGRYSSAYVALGGYNFEKGNLKLASDYYAKALQIKPLMPSVWFRLGTVSMQLGEWDTALKAFSEAVQQEPEEADAWANVAAIHLHNRNPAEAYPALLESLRQNRNNWRVWISKLYTCIDLKKYDEAVQACHVLLDMKSKEHSSDAIPDLEKRCIRAIVGGSLEESVNSRGDPAAMQSSVRTLTRVQELLRRLSSTSKTEAWIWETMAYFNERLGRDEEVFDNLMKEYRALQTIRGWEKDEKQVRKVCQVVSQIAHFHQLELSRESLSKCKFLVSGVVKKIRAAYLDGSNLPEEVCRLEAVLTSVEEALKTV